MEIRILSVHARSGGEETEVTFEIKSDTGEHCARESFILSAGQYLTLGLAVGESDSDQYDEVMSASQIWSATKRAVNLLGYGTCSEKALRAKLVSKGIDKETAALAVAGLVERGLIRAEDDATRLAEKMAAKLWGKRRIVSGLYEKGYSSETVSSAVDALEDAGIDYVENCRILISKRYSDVDITDKDAQRKMFAALMRYGYSAAEIKQAIKG